MYQRLAGHYTRGDSRLRNCEIHAFSRPISHKKYTCATRKSRKPHLRRVVRCRARNGQRFLWTPRKGQYSPDRKSMSQTARMAEKRTPFDFKFKSLKKHAFLSESTSEECISGEQLDKNNHVSSSMGIQTVMRVKKLMKSEGQSIWQTANQWRKNQTVSMQPSNRDGFWHGLGW